jgi:hypothetical protein
MIIQYILCIFILIVFSFFTYIKIKYPFWNNQPVFHTYDYWRSLNNTPFIVYKFCPIKTKFCDFIYTKTINYLECSQKEKEQFVDLIQCYYIPNERIIHNIELKHFDAYFTGLGEPSFVSFYNENVYSIETENETNQNSSSNNVIVKETIPEIKCSLYPIGVITSRHIKMFYVSNKNDTFYTQCNLYFIDFLSVHRERDKKTISRKLLQTHEYNQRIQNPNIKISLIKKEIELFEGVVPFVQFNSTIYNIRNNKFPKLPQHFHIVRIYIDNIHLLTDFIHLQKQSNSFGFDIFVIPDIGSLSELIKENLFYIYCLKKGEDILGYYFIKDVKTQYDDLTDENTTAHTLHCITSIINTKNERLFYLGFLHTLREIVKTYKIYKMIIFDEIGHNTVLVKHWRGKYSPIFTNKNAYYLYNFIFPRSPVLTEKVFIIL